ncbi:MAG: DUF4837 family protein [Gemmatimonadota bacterium]
MILLATGVRPRWSVLLIVVTVGLWGCDKPRALGEPRQILVAAPQGLWDALEEDIKNALEPRTFTVRDERVFDVAHVDPIEPGWADLRIMRQILVIGPPENPAVAAAIEAYDSEIPPAPGVFQVRNLWAREQLVTVAVLPAGGDPESLRPLLQPLGQTLLNQFEQYARTRMFVTGPDEELRDSLSRNAGFTLTLPRVYRAEELEPGVFQFRNDQPDPSQLIRNITVASRPSDEAQMSAESAAQWRAELAERLTQPPQETQAGAEGHSLEINGRPALQIDGIWSNPPNQWPAAGPFITRLVECPDRTFLVDAWLYAPGTAKYEYMFQLNTIIDSFECAPGGAGAA